MALDIAIDGRLGAAATAARREWLVDLGCIAAVALAVRVVLAVAVVIPPADDPAYYVTVARNLSLGRGFVTDVVWQYHSPPAAITHPAGDLWMPLPSLLMALVFAVAGPSWGAAQLPGVLMGAGLAVLTYAIGRQLLAGGARERLLAAFAALLVALNGVLAYQSASGDSSAPFSLLAAMGIWLAGLQVSERSPVALGSALSRLAGPVAAGLMLGAAYLARSDALFVLAGLVLATLLPSQGRTGWRGASANIVVMGLAALAAVTPWLLRNLAEFGTPTPIPVGLLAGLARYEDLFNFTGAGSLMPGTGPGLASALALRAGALWHNWHQVLDFLFFPTAALPAIGLMLLRRRGTAGAALLALAFTLVCTAIAFPVPAMAGTFYHDAGAFAPWLAVGLVYLASRAMTALCMWRRWRSDLLGIALAAILVVTVAQLVLAGVAVSAQHKAERRRLMEAASFLATRPPGPVISTSPYNLNFHTGRPGLMLPVLQEPAAVRQLAGRYGARYLVVLGDYGIYPGALSGSPGCGGMTPAVTGFCVASGGEGWLVFEMN